MNGEINVLNHYNLTNAFPTTWPAEKDESDDTEEEKVINGSKTGVRRSKSRYSALDRKGSDGRRSLVPGSQKLRDGQEALVQKDEADPLGASETVVQALRQKGLPVEEDAQLSETNHVWPNSLADSFQEIDFSCHQPRSRLTYTYPRFIPMLRLSNCFKA